jgi:hypothetical protein
MTTMIFFAVRSAKDGILSALASAGALPPRLSCRSVRRAVRIVATVMLLAGPAVLAFHAGGYFDGPRAAAACIAWAVVFALALTGPAPLPRSRAGWIAVAGLAGLAAWSAISLSWAPLAAPAGDSVQRLLLYLGVLLAALGLLRDPRAARAVEPVLALGALVVIGYGLSGRWLPGLVDLPRSYGAGGRLEQPLTYWNAEGLLAATGLLLCVRLSGDGSRPLWLRVAAASACAPFGMGLYLSYSRGAVAVAVVGLIVLLAVTPSWSVLRSTVAGVCTGIVAAVASVGFPGVASLEGSTAERQRDGAVVLALLIVVMLAAAAAAVRLDAAERRGAARRGRLPRSRALRVAAPAAVLLCLGGLVVGGLLENGDESVAAAATPSRYASVDSLRYEYWRVGLEALAREPVTGVGAGGFRVVWRDERRVDVGATDVHSLVLEQAVELGLPGLLLLGMFVGGVAAAARRALRAGEPLAAGACAVCVAWLLHAAIDWDWQLPAVTLPALVLAGGLLARDGEPPPPAAGTERDEAAGTAEPPVVPDHQPVGASSPL